MDTHANANRAVVRALGLRGRDGGPGRQGFAPENREQTKARVQPSSQHQRATVRIRATTRTVISTMRFMAILLDVPARAPMVWPCERPYPRWGDSLSSHRFVQDGDRASHRSRITIASTTTPGRPVTPVVRSLPPRTSTMHRPDVALNVPWMIAAAITEWALTRM